MGTITILPETTKNPITLMGRRAGCCWNANITDDEKNYKRGFDCIKSGHGRVMEYPNVEMIIDGYSAKTIREYYTHIVGASRLQASTRYIDYSKGEGFGYITPQSINNDEDVAATWHGVMRYINTYIQHLINNGATSRRCNNVTPINLLHKNGR